MMLSLYLVFSDHPPPGTPRDYRSKSKLLNVPYSLNPTSASSFFSLFCLCETWFFSLSCPCETSAWDDQLDAGTGRRLGGQERILQSRRHNEILNRHACEQTFVECLPRGRHCPKVLMHNSVNTTRESVIPI